MTGTEIEDYLIDFQLHLNNRGYIVNHDWDFQKEAMIYIKLYMSQIKGINKQSINKLNSSKMTKANKKIGTVMICDSRRKVGNVYNQAFRVKSVAPNGEIMQCSEVLNDKKAVMTHIKAMAKLFASSHMVISSFVTDNTSKNLFKKEIGL